MCRNIRDNIIIGLVLVTDLELILFLSNISTSYFMIGLDHSDKF